ARIQTCSARRTRGVYPRSSSHHNVAGAVETRNKHKFYMFHGKCIVTLEDVAILTVLPVTGEAVYREYNNKEMNWAALVGEVLGETSGLEFVKADERLKIS
ncbi:hypothetical protein LINGRAHAP2_LOCUS21135, partial [Linum grandiflorum]